MAKHVTLKQVAAQAGVSYQTVSKVLNKQMQVSKETEERILQTVRLLGYRPNQIARNMRAQRSRMIGYSWIPTPSDQVNSILDHFLQSMAEAAESAGYHVLCFPYHSGLESILAYQELIDTHRVDGFIISSVEYDDPRIPFLLERDFPFVAFGRSNPDWDFPYADVDAALGMYMVTEHLLNLGHQRIAALAWPEASRVGQNRIEGYFTALRTAGIEPLPEWIQRGEGNYRFGLQASSHWLDWPLERLPTAIVAFNDVMAIGALNAIQQRGLRVGVDIAVTGFDDSPMIQYLNPSLTSVSQPVWEIGQQVMSMLLGILNNMPPADLHRLLAPQLIIRQSSNALAG